MLCVYGCLVAMGFVDYWCLLRICLAVAWVLVGFEFWLGIVWVLVDLGFDWWCWVFAFFYNWTAVWVFVCLGWLCYCLCLILFVIYCLCCGLRLFRLDLWLLVGGCVSVCLCLVYYDIVCWCNVGGCYLCWLF